MRTSALARGIAGFVVDGAVRDIAEWAEGTVACYARGHTHRGPTKDGPGQVNVPIACAGMAVMPGDLVVGDADDVIVLPAGEAADVLPRLRAHLLQEGEIRDRDRSGRTDGPGAVQHAAACQGLPGPTRGPARSVRFALKGWAGYDRADPAEAMGCAVPQTEPRGRAARRTGARRMLGGMMPIDRRNLLIALTGALAGGLTPTVARAAQDGGSDRAAGAAEKRVRAGVLDVAYLESGPADGRPVVLLHGFPYDVHAFDGVAPRLAAAGRRVIVPYLRGYGPTRFVDAATPRVGQQAALGGDLLALLDALDLRRATLAGFDWGARAACVVAALHPERVSGLVTSGGPGYNVQNQADFLKPRRPQFERDHWFYWYLNSQRGMTAFSEDPAGLCRYLWAEFSPSWRFDDATYGRSAASFSNPDFVAVALHSYRFRIGAVPGDPALEATERRLSAGPQITVPTIVIPGADDGVDPPDGIESIAPHFTALRRMTVLRGIGHNAPQEAPDRFAAAVLDVDP